MHVMPGARVRHPIDFLAENLVLDRMGFYDIRQFGLTHRVSDAGPSDSRDRVPMLYARNR